MVTRHRDMALSSRNEKSIEIHLKKLLHIHKNQLLPEMTLRFINDQRHEQIEKLSHELEQTKSDWKSCQKELKASKARIQTLETQIKTFKSHVEILEGKLTESEKSSDLLEKEMKQIRKETANLKERERRYRDQTAIEIQEAQRALQRVRFKKDSFDISICY